MVGNGVVGSKGWWESGVVGYRVVVRVRGW